MGDRASVLLAFGCNLRAARAKKKVSQEQLALTAGLDRTYVGGIERGERNPSLFNICRLAGALGVRPARLLRGVALRGGPPPSGS
jgi:transcriptional regulator with XRE-family HTH domain